MAFIFSDSFDFYTAVALNPTDLPQGGWTSVYRPSDISISSTVTRFGVGKSISLINTAQLGKTFSSNTSDTVFLNVSYYNSTVIVPSPDMGMFFVFGDMSTDQFAICFLKNGSIQLRTGGPSGAVAATYSSAFAINEWNNFQFKVKIHPSAGTFSVRRNGSSVDSFAATGLDTQQTANSYANYLVFGNSLPFISNWADDLYIFDDSGSAPNTWTGDLRSYSLTATADTAQKDFTPQGSPDNYANVGKFSTDTATYNYAGTVGNEDLFDITDLSVTPAFISSVVVKTVMQKSDSNPIEGQPVIVSNVTTSTGTSVNLSTSWVGYLDCWPTDPDTSAPWSAAGVNALQVGYKVSA